MLKAPNCAVPVNALAVRLKASSTVKMASDSSRSSPRYATLVPNSCRPVSSLLPTTVTSSEKLANCSTTSNAAPSGPVAETPSRCAVSKPGRLNETE